MLTPAGQKGLGRKKKNKLGNEREPHNKNKWPRKNMLLMSFPTTMQKAASLGVIIHLKIYAGNKVALLSLPAAFFNLARPSSVCLSGRRLSCCVARLQDKLVIFLQSLFRFLFEPQAPQVHCALFFSSSCNYQT